MHHHKIVAIIPARLESTRLPRKLLCDLGGKSVLIRTCDAVVSTNLFDEVWVACDDLLLVQEVEKYGYNAMITSVNHSSGTDRIAEVAMKIDASIYINVQADEPFITKEALQKIIELFQVNDEIDVASLKKRIFDDTEISNSNCVKVVTNQDGKALYFSRAAIPFNREASTEATYFKHIGVYGFKRNSLLAFSSLRASYLEQIEKLENLRMLENNMSIYLAEIEHEGISIDTLQDLEKARVFFKK